MDDLYDPSTREQRALADYRDKRWTPRRSRIPWVADLRDRAKDAGLAFFHKQWGGAAPKAAGRELEGKNLGRIPSLTKKRCLNVRSVVAPSDFVRSCGFPTLRPPAHIVKWKAHQPSLLARREFSLCFHHEDNRIRGRENLYFHLRQKLICTA
jgi:hypothetical protein